MLAPGDANSCLFPACLCLCRPLSRNATCGESMQRQKDLERPETASDWTCGYTGHVPRLRDTFAVRNVFAASFLKADEAMTESAGTSASRPRTTASTPSSRSGMSSVGGGPRVEGVVGGQRRLLTSPTLKYPGNGFCGTLLPARRTDRVSQMQVYDQGTKVNLSSYYDTCEAANYRISQIQSGFAGKNKSNIRNGDLYYFSGKHMYETTQSEAYCPPEKKSEHEKLTYDEEMKLVKERLRKYAVSKAVVGKARIDAITLKLTQSLEARVSGGTGFRRRMFGIFDKNGERTLNIFCAIFS